MGSDCSKENSTNTEDLGTKDDEKDKKKKEQKEAEKEEEEEERPVLANENMMKPKEEVFRLDEKLMSALRKKYKLTRRTNDKQKRYHAKIIKANYGPGVWDAMSPEEKRIHTAADMFEKFEKWEFDMLDFAKLTDYRPLPYVAYVMMIKFGLLKKFNIGDKILFRFLTAVEGMYDEKNPLRNSTRAADALHAFSYLLRKGMGSYLCDEDIMVGIMSGCCLYLDHPFLDNRFQANSDSSAATIYNDFCPLQNHALRTFFEIMETDQRLNIFLNMSKDQRRFIRSQAISSVIATATEGLEMKSILFSVRKSITSGSDFSSKDDVKILHQVAMMLCEHAVWLRPKDVFKKWVKQKVLHAVTQAAVERDVGLPVTPFGENRTFRRAFAEKFDKQIKPVIKVVSQLLPQLKSALSQTFRKNKQLFVTQPKAKVEPEKKDESKFDYYDISSIESILPGHLLLEQQKRFDEKVRATLDFPEDRQLNIKPEDPDRLVPDDEQKAINQNCFEFLKKRWAIGEGKTRAVMEKEPKIWAKCDYEDLDGPMSDDDVEYSINAMYERIDEWNFDVFALTQLLQDDALFLTSYVLFVKYDFLRRFKIPEKTLLAFLNAVQSGYQNTPYHNAMHAVDVMQVTNVIAKKGGMLPRLTEVDLIAAIVASMVHDLDHPGYNDAFQVHSHTYLAKLYNDRSVLEFHHCSKCFQFMRYEGMDIFAGMTAEERRDCRKTMADMIISTDMSNHAKYVRAFNELVEKEVDFSRKDDLRVALQIVIKMSDVSNPARPIFIYLSWTSKIIKEFFRQGDAEKLYNLPISPLMDRETSVLGKGQRAFMEYVLVPMFKSFASVFKESTFMVKRLQANMKYWEENEVIEEAYLDPSKLNDRIPLAKLSKEVCATNRDLYESLYERDKKKHSTSVM